MNMVRNRIKVIGEHALIVGEIFAYTGVGIKLNPFNLPFECATKDSNKEFGTDYITITEVNVNHQYTVMTVESNGNPCNGLLEKIFSKWDLLFKVFNEWFCSETLETGSYEITLFGKKEIKDNEKLRID